MIFIDSCFHEIIDPKKFNFIEYEVSFGANILKKIKDPFSNEEIILEKEYLLKGIISAINETQLRILAKEVLLKLFGQIYDDFEVKILSKKILETEAENNFYFKKVKITDLNSKPKIRI